MSIPKMIEVVTIPHGEAPEEVRRGWIGCVMPCEPECGHVPVYVEGVLSGPSLLVKVAGFSISQEVALAVLEQKAPQAAEWFRQHGFPHPDKCFRFKDEEVRVVAAYAPEEELKLGPLHVYDDMETGTMRRIF